MGFPWVYLTDAFLAEPLSSARQMALKLSKSEVNSLDFFFEIVQALNDKRCDRSKLVQITNGIISNTTDANKKSDFSTDFCLLIQSMPQTAELDLFAKEIAIDNKFKILYLSPTLLKTQGIFPDFLKYKYNDAKSEVFCVESYSNLHESAQGYSKFITEILIFLDTPNDINSLHSILNRLMGNFKLDWNRCFLILVSILSFHLNNKNLVLNILKTSQWWRKSDINYTLQTVITNYLLNFQNDECKELEIITMLIKEGIFEFNTIYNSLGPLDFDIVESAEIIPKENKELENIFIAWKKEELTKSKISNVSALAMAAPLVDSDDEGEGNKTEENKKKEIEISVCEKIKLMRKIDFLKCLLKEELVDESLYVLVEYPFLPIINDEISDLLNNLIEKIIEPLYQNIVNPLNITKHYNNFIKNDKIEYVENTDQLFNTASKFVSFNKHKLGRNSILVTKLLRIMKCDLTNYTENNDISEEFEKLKSKAFEKWLQFFRLFIFPCLPFMSNIPITTEAYQIMEKFYTLTDRYNLYGEYQVLSKRNDDQKLNWDRTEKKTRDLLKRISIENVSVFSRSLNKLTSANPLASTNAFVSHIESYSSLVELVSDCSKFFNDFAWDVLTFQLLNKLNGNKPTMQNDGLNYTSWFINLSSFIGTLGKSYPEFFKLAPIIINVVKSLSIGDTDVLAVFKEILTSMTGIKPITNLNSKQIIKMNGGTGLRRLTYFSIDDERHKCIKSCQKLLNALVDENVLCELFVLLCQIPQNLFNSATDKPLKFVNQRADDVNSLIHTLIQSIDENMNTDLFSSLMIPFPSLIKDYNVSPQWAFEVWRLHWSKQIIKNDNKSNGAFGCSHEEFKNILPIEEFNEITIEFYLTFWQLSLYDINFEDISYVTELTDLKSRINGLQIRIKNNQRDPAFSKVEQGKLEYEYRNLIQIYNLLRTDSSHHKSNYETVMERLLNEKDKWFNSDKDVSAFTEYCILPRLHHSSFDAMFVAKFIFLLNKIETPNYKLKDVIESLFTWEFLPMGFFTNTSMETENLSLFFGVLLEKLNFWWSFSISNKDKSNLDEQFALHSGLLLTHSEFKSWYHKLLDALLNQLLLGISSDKYTTRNNTIIFLKGILENYPTIEQHAALIADKLEEISNEDIRDDIKLASRALIGLLGGKKGKVVPIWEFYDMDQLEKEKAMIVKAERMKKKKEIEEKIRLEKKKQEEERKKIEEELKLKQIEAERLKREKEDKEKEELAGKLLEKSKGASYGLVGLTKKETKISDNENISDSSKNIRSGTNSSKTESNDNSNKNREKNSPQTPLKNDMSNKESKNNSKDKLSSSGTLDTQIKNDKKSIRESTPQQKKQDNIPTRKPLPLQKDMRDIQQQNDQRQKQPQPRQQQYQHQQYQHKHHQPQQPQQQKLQPQQQKQQQQKQQPHHPQPQQQQRPQQPHQNQRHQQPQQQQRPQKPHQNQRPNQQSVQGSQIKTPLIPSKPLDQQNQAPRKYFAADNRGKYGTNDQMRRSSFDRMNGNSFNGRRDHYQQERYYDSRNNDMRRVGQGQSKSRSTQQQSPLPPPPPPPPPPPTNSQSGGNMKRRGGDHGYGDKRQRR
ncbi:Tho2 protein [Martiniozyma asiatica (nom. inval.)]|nr:Tho2 protein [Martiniozyma asiatica]